MGFLGHTARRGTERLEWKAIFAWLDPESEYAGRVGQRLCWSKQVQPWLHAIEQKYEDKTGETLKWHEIANVYNAKGVHKTWNELKKGG